MSWTREQRNAVEALSLEHGNAEVTMSRTAAGALAHVECEDGTRCYIDEDGKVGGMRQMLRLHGPERRTSAEIIEEERAR